MNAAQCDFWLHVCRWSHKDKIQQSIGRAQSRAIADRYTIGVDGFPFR
jgi:hypothetical protein